MIGPSGCILPRLFYRKVGAVQLVVGSWLSPKYPVMVMRLWLVLYAAWRMVTARVGNIPHLGM